MPKADAPYPIQDAALAWFSAKERDFITDGQSKLDEVADRLEKAEGDEAKQAIQAEQDALSLKVDRLNAAYVARQIETEKLKESKP